MTTERKGLLKFQDVDVTVIGDDLKVGDLAPDFLVHTMDWSSSMALAIRKAKCALLVRCPV